MNEQTKGPITVKDSVGCGLELHGPTPLLEGYEIPRERDKPVMLFSSTSPQIVPLFAERWIQFEEKGWHEWQTKNAAVLAASYNQLDAAARKLEIDALNLAKLDLAELIERVRQLTERIEEMMDDQKWDHSSEWREYHAVKQLLSTLPQKASATK